MRPDAFIFLRRDRRGGLSAIGGGRLEDDWELMAVNTVLAALAGMAAGGDVERARRGARSAARAAAFGDFGLPEEELMRIAEKLPNDNTAIVVFFENLWERRFRDIAGKYSGSVVRQQLIPSDTLIQLGEELKKGPEPAGLGAAPLSRSPR